MDEKTENAIANKLNFFQKTRNKIGSSCVYIVESDERINLTIAPLLSIIAKATNESGETKMSENQTNSNRPKQPQSVRLAKMGMLVAISIVLVYFIHIPMFTAFYEYDPADIPILMGTFAFGPWAGLLLTIVTSIIQGATVSAGSGVYGIIMHIIATGAFVLAAGLIYKGGKTKKRAIIALVCGVLAMVIIMIPANILITPYFMGAPRSAVVAMVPVIIGFNFTKAGINAVITFILYKRLSKFLHR